MAASGKYFDVFGVAVQMPLPGLTGNTVGQQVATRHAPTADLQSIAEAAYGPLTHHLPTFNRGAALPGGMGVPSFKADWYNRIHVSTALLALGNVVSDQTRTVSVWNAWLTKTVTLTGVQGVNTDGIAVGQPQEPLPLTYGILQSYNYVISASTAGSPIINAEVIWNFGADGTVSTTITGNRITAWTVSPDWTSQLVETFEFLTDVEIAYDGTEVRTGLRSTPRRRWAFSSMAWAGNRQYAENALFNWNKRIWALPVWTDIQLITQPAGQGQTNLPCNTDDLDFAAGELAILLQDVRTFEVMEVLDVNDGSIDLKNGLSNTWPRGTKLYPMRKARLTKNPTISRHTDNSWSTNVEFQSVEANAFTPTPTWPSYRGYPVIEDSMDWEDDPQMSFDRISNQIDNGTGIPVVYEQSGFTQPVESYSWRVFSKAARTALKAILYALNGRENIVWIPTWADDLTVVQSIASSAVGLICDYSGYALFNNGAQNRQDLRIELWNGTIFYRRVLSAADLDNGTEQLNLDSALGTTLPASAFKRVCFLVCSRLDTDTVDLSYDTDSQLTMNVSFRGVPDNV